MTPEEEIEQLKRETNQLQEQLAQRDALIEQLLQRVQVLEERLGKDSHNSHLPPSSDRFVRQPRSLRKKAGRNLVDKAVIVGRASRFRLRPTKWWCIRCNAAKPVSIICMRWRCVAWNAGKSSIFLRLA